MAVLIIKPMGLYACVCSQLFIGPPNDLVLNVKSHHADCEMWVILSSAEQEEKDFAHFVMASWVVKGSRMTDWRLSNLLPRAARLWLD